MRASRLASLVLVFTASAASAAVANRSDAGFVYNGANGPFNVGAAVCPGTVVATLPASLPGTTCGDTNSITNYNSAACLASLNFPYPGEDEVYQITLGAGNNVAFSADLTGSTGDLALFLLTTCGTGSSCIDTSQDAIGPGVGPELIAAATYPAGTYFVYLDSYYGVGNQASCGTYTLNITGTLPVELIDFQVN